MCTGFFIIFIIESNVCANSCFDSDLCSFFNEFFNRRWDQCRAMLSWMYFFWNAGRPQWNNVSRAASTAAVS